MRKYHVWTHKNVTRRQTWTEKLSVAVNIWQQTQISVKTTIDNYLCLSVQRLYWKKRITIVICARHTGQPASNSATRRAQLSQKRACPHGTNANPWRGAVRHTSQDSSLAGGSDTDELDADDVVVVAVVISVSSVSSSLLLLSPPLPRCPLLRCPPLLPSCRLVHSRVVNSRDFSAPFARILFVTFYVALL